MVLSQKGTIIRRDRLFKEPIKDFVELYAFVGSGSEYMFH